MIVKERICWCEKVFTVTAREALNLLDDFDLFCSEECLIQYVSNAKKTATKLPKNSPIVPYDFNNYDPVTKNFYRSLFEVWLARCFKAHNIKFKYEPHAFLLDGRYYTPDFYLPEKEIYIECKGLWKKLGKTKVRLLKEHAHLLLLPSYFQKCLRQYRRKDDLVK